MLKSNNIAIISPNTLLCLGVQTLLESFFTPSVVSVFANANLYYNSNIQYHFIFLTSDVYIAQYNNFQPLKNRVIILTEGNNETTHNQKVITTVDITLPLSDITDMLHNYFETRLHKTNINTTEELSLREIDVLKLVAVGKQNKDIADQLFISMHTVITHRKNITRKLGIKTVSGLTVYAILNGLISSADIE